MALVFFFIDGVGLGAESDHNPFTQANYASFSFLAGDQPFTSQAHPLFRSDHVFTSLDACLGVTGLPQSGTGQVALFSGMNAPQMLGRHFGPYPHSKLRDTFVQNSLFIQMEKAGGSTYFMNAYPEIFFEYASKKNRWSSTTLMSRSSGKRLHTLEHIRNGTATTADITQRAWIERLHLDVPEIKPVEAGQRVIKAADSHDLVLMEYYLTDSAGHSKDRRRARDILTLVDRFLIELVHLCRRSGHTLLVTSDHGNLEDLSTRSHTVNRVPLIVYGPGAHLFYGASALTDVTPMITDWYRSMNRKSVYNSVENIVNRTGSVDRSKYP